MLEKILKLINSRKDVPLQVIPGYSDKEQPSKPYATAYIINNNMQDTYWIDNEDKKEDIINESTKIYTQTKIQFDVFGKTEQETRNKSIELLKLIMYKMRYKEWEENSVGIVDISGIRTLNEKSTANSWIYRNTFDVMFESYLIAERTSEIIKKIILEINEKEIK